MRWPVVRLIARARDPRPAPRPAHAVPHPRPAGPHVPAVRRRRAAVSSRRSRRSSSSSAWWARSICRRRSRTFRRSPAPRPDPLQDVACLPAAHCRRQIPRRVTSLPTRTAACSSSSRSTPPTKDSLRRARSMRSSSSTPNSRRKLERGERPTVRVLSPRWRGELEARSAAAHRRAHAVGRRREGRPVRPRAGCRPTSTCPIEVKDPLTDKPAEKKMFDELRDVLVKVIPFLLVMWMLTGSIYPAIDMTAGEKERGTMETLLISPAERSEIVFGKFFAVVAMGFGTAVWNVALMLVAVAVVQIASFRTRCCRCRGWARACWRRCRWRCSSPRAGWRSASSPAAPRRATTTWCRCSSSCCRFRTGA